MKRYPHHTACFMALALASGLVGGCSGQKPTKAFELYNQGSYAESYREAEAFAAQKEGQGRDEAALVAGMSAYELRRYDDAQKWLRPVTRSSDPVLSGRAFATLGLVSVRQDRFSTAAMDLASAGRRLEADQAAEAYYLAGECHTLMGDLERARSMYNKALGEAKSPAVRAKISDRLQTSDYTLQLGAFSNRANADKMMTASARRAQQASLPPPRISEAKDVAGRTIFLVQLGQFKTRSEAVAARTRLGGEAVVVPMRK